MKQILAFILFISSCFLQNIYAFQTSENRCSNNSLNKKIIYEFLNFEFFNKNKLYQTHNYFHTRKSENIKYIIHQFKEEGVTFEYDSNDNLIHISQILNTNNSKRPDYIYDFNYSKNKLETIQLFAKERYNFYYERDLLRKIVFDKKSVNRVFFVNYSNDNKKIEITSKHPKNKLRKIEISLNDNCGIVALSSNKFSFNNVIYNKEGNMISLSFSNEKLQNSQLNWVYLLDKKGNWITKEEKGNMITRKIIYR